MNPFDTQLPQTEMFMYKYLRDTFDTPQHFSISAKNETEADALAMRKFAELRRGNITKMKHFYRVTPGVPKKKGPDIHHFLIGTALVIGGALVVAALKLLGFSGSTAKIIGVTIAISGFITQMWAAFGMRAAFLREQRLLQERHEVLMEQARFLPPEEAVRMLTVQ